MLHTLLERRRKYIGVILSHERTLKEAIITHFNIDLSKAFECLHHGLSIAKLDAYDVDIKSVKLIQKYLSDTKQRVRLGNAYSS